MKITPKVAIVAAVLGLVAAPAIALPPQAPSNQGTEHAPGDAPSGKPSNPGPKAGLPAKAKAYGRYCRSFSRKHVAGQKGTPFSKCVTDMAKLGSGRTDSPRKACSDQSKRRVAGQRGTPFSRCVSAGAKLLKDEAEAA